MIKQKDKILDMSTAGQTAMLEAQEIIFNDDYLKDNWSDTKFKRIMDLFMIAYKEIPRPNAPIAQPPPRPPPRAQIPGRVYETNRERRERFIQSDSVRQERRERRLADIHRVYEQYGSAAAERSLRRGASRDTITSAEQPQAVEQPQAAEQPQAVEQPTAEPVSAPSQQEIFRWQPGNRVGIRERVYPADICINNVMCKYCRIIKRTNSFCTDDPCIVRRKLYNTCRKCVNPRYFGTSVIDIKADDIKRMLSSIPNQFRNGLWWIVSAYKLYQHYNGISLTVNIMRTDTQTLADEWIIENLRHT